MALLPIAPLTKGRSIPHPATTLFVCWCFCLSVSVVTGLRRLPTTLHDPGLQRLDIPAVSVPTNEDDTGMKQGGVAAAMSTASPSTGEEDTLTPSSGAAESSFVRRLWGVPDAVAQAGLQFTLTLPADAFTGHVTQYQLSLADGGALPSWLHFDAANRRLEGKPTSSDIGLLLIQVKAKGDAPHDVDTDKFALEILPAGTNATSAALDHAQQKVHAHSSDSCVATPLFVYLVLDVDAADLRIKQKEIVAQTFAKYLQIPPDQVSLSSEDTHMALVLSGDALDAGPGHVKKQRSPTATTLMARVPCSTASADAVTLRLKTDAAKPTLSSVLGFPVLGWYTANKDAETLRSKRQTAGSGDDYEEDGDYEYDPDFDEEGTVAPSEPITRAVPTLSTPVFLQPSHTLVLSSTVAPTPVITASHPLIPSYIPTPALIPVRPTRIVADPRNRVIEEDESVVEVEPTPVLVPQSSSSLVIAPSSSSVEIIQPTPTMVLVTPSPVVKEEDDYEEEVDEDLDEENEVEEEQAPPPKNSPPIVTKKVSLPVTAGKLLVFTIPSNTFLDNEDGATRNLKLSLTKENGEALDENSWITFKPETQEIFALPLEEEIGKWTFRLTATDSHGASVSELVNVVVRQHSASRVFHHTITLELEPDTKVLHTWLDWAVRTIKGLTTMMGDMDTEAVMVRKITLDPPSLAFTNDTLPRGQYCPEDLVLDLYERLATEQEATDELEEALAPELAATNVTLTLQGVCEPQPKPPTTPPINNVFPKGPAVPVEEEPANHVPSWRNPVDYAEAQVGRLLRFQVKDDACFDEEDGATPRLRLELLAADRTPLQPAFWLQFDSANNEFYGLPMEDDVGTHELQLICMDSAGATATDGLVVEVKPRPENNKPVVEFSLKVDVDYEDVQNSAQRKVRLIETLSELFEDPDPTRLVVHTIRPGSTVISWTNASLATETCPQADIQELRKQLFDEDERLTVKAVEILTKAAFPPLSASLIPLGACLGELTPTHGPDAGVEIVTEEDPSDDKPKDNSGDDYLLTFIVPGIIIACMLLLAGLIACVLYRRRRSGKMRLDERQGKSFLSKGIPVIFAGELEERPSAPVSSPLILKDEQSPHAGTNPPPTYPAASAPEQRQLLRSPPDEEEDNGPYSPPPPLAANANNKDSKGRPKATPAYRKPPPYVPP